MLHGFVRTAEGAVTAYDLPNVGTGTDEDTGAAGINNAGTITGFYIDSSGVPIAFVCTATGVVTTFNVSGATETFAAAINTSGAVVGNYLNSSSNSRGYLRSASGAIATFDALGSGTTKGTGTFVYGINSCLLYTSRCV